MRLHLGAMDEAAVRPGVEMVEHPFDRPRAEDGGDLVHFGNLFGQVHVERVAGGQRVVARQVVRRDGPQAVGRNTGPAIGRQNSDEPNLVVVQSLSSLERDLLRQALHIVKDFKQRLTQRFHLE